MKFSSRDFQLRKCILVAFLGHTDTLGQPRNIVKQPKCFYSNLIWYPAVLPYRNPQKL